MSQKEQILQVLSRALSTFGSLITLTQNTTAQHIIKEQIRDLNKTIAYVKETPEHEPAPLVRLTEEEQLKIVNFFLNCGLDNWQKLWQCSNAIMDVMEQRNGGSE